MKVTALYFASLRDAAGCETETIDTEAGALRELYESLRARHGFVFPADRLRVAMGAEFVGWDTPLYEGAEIAFIPPVSGG